LDQAKGREIRVQQHNGSKVDVQVEPKSQTQQNVASMLIARDAWVTQGTQEDCIDVVAHVLEGRIRECLFGLEVMIGRVGKMFPV